MLDQAQHLFAHYSTHSCISHIRSCPLCRTPFDSSSCIRLHVDVNTISREQTVGCSSDVVKEAQRLHQAISSIADVGIDKQGLRQLIQEAKPLLHGQPRHLVSTPRNFLEIGLFMLHSTVQRSSRCPQDDRVPL